MGTASETKATIQTVASAPSIDQVMEEDKKKELLKGVDIDASCTTTEAPTNINGGSKKSMALVDYNDSDSDGEENGGSSDEDLPPRKKVKNLAIIFLGG